VWSEIRKFTAAVREQLRLAGLLSREERPVTAVDPLKWTQEERRRSVRGGGLQPDSHGSPVVRTTHRGAGMTPAGDAMSADTTKAPQNNPPRPRRTSFPAPLTSKIASVLPSSCKTAPYPRECRLLQ
jgi:hypothetical protein